MKLLLYFLFFLFISPLFSANFACGYVTDSENHSSDWLDVLIYYEEDTATPLFCTINPENKYCCDVETISTVEWSVGKKIYAEVFDEQTSFVSNKEELFLSEEGYDVFSDLHAEPAFSLQPFQRVLVGKDTVSLTLLTHPRYPGIRYKVFYENTTFEEEICASCGGGTFDLFLGKGENEIELTVFGERAMSKNISVYSLDYLNISREVACEGCSSFGSYLVVPPKKEVTMNIKFNSSHLISGELIDYFPVSWTLSPEDEIVLEEFSETHNRVHFDIEGKEFTQTYNLTSPQIFFPRIYDFSAEFEGHSFDEKIKVSWFKYFPNIFYWKKRLNRQIYFGSLVKETFISPSRPLITFSEDPILEFIGFYPESEQSHTYALVFSKKNLFWKRSETRYYIKTNLRDNNLEKILVHYKIPLEKSHLVKQKRKEIPSVLLETDEQYRYYESILYSKKFFSIRLV